MTQGGFRVFGLKLGEVVSILTILGVVAGGAFAYANLRGEVQRLANQHDTLQKHQHNAAGDNEPFFVFPETNNLRFQEEDGSGRTIKTKKHTGGVDDPKIVGDETRPINMSVVWIIRVK